MKVKTEKSCGSGRFLTLASFGIACVYLGRQSAHLGLLAETTTPVTTIDSLETITTVAKARAVLAHALMRTWDLDRDEEMIMLPKGSISSARYFLDKFVQECASSKLALPVAGQTLTCLDWSNRYVRQFPGCTTKYDYKFSGEKNIFRRAQQGEIGLIQGDLGEDMQHVPAGLINLAIVTQVFEHVPHFWNAFPNLSRIMAPGGVVLFTVPFAYRWHPFPGDFYRYSPMAIIHAFESSDFVLCQMSTDGWRSLQMHALGLNMEDIGDETYLTQPQSKFSLLVGASNYNAIFQKRNGKTDKCSLDTVSLTNELLRSQLEAFAKGWWPENMEGFPAGGGGFAASN
jgi:SAM-dependent methyltransferase